MIGFFFAATVLLALVAILLFSRRSLAPRAADAEDPNLGWYQQRAAELHNADDALIDEARLRLLEDGVGVAGEPAAAPARFPVLPLVLLIAVAGIAIYWKTGSIEDVLIYESLVQLRPDASAEERDALRKRLESRSRARQDNVQYLGLLGQLYMADEDFAAASRTYARLVEEAPQDSQALALAAQARFLAAGRQLDDEAQLMAERALAIDPAQRTALGLLGMASFEAGSYNASVSYWERLQALEQPGSQGYQMLEEVLAMARSRAGVPAVAAAPAATVTPAADAPGISVELVLPPAASLDPAATVFVFARPAGSAGGMPVAVRRLRVADLPLTLRLGDDDAMAGQLLSQAGDVLVTAQVSANGQPGIANAVMSGVAGPVSAGGENTSVRIELRPAAEAG